MGRPKKQVELTQSDSDLDSIDFNGEQEDKNAIAKYTGKSFAEALILLEGITAACANKIVEHISTEIITALITANKVYIRGVGCLYLVYYPAKFGRHPKTGNTIWIKESLRVKFKPSGYITKAINQNIKQIKEFAEITIDNQPPEAVNTNINNKELNDLVVTQITL